MVMGDRMANKSIILKGQQNVNRRRRVRLPGKYIVVLGLLPALVLTGLISFHYINTSRYQPVFEVEVRKDEQGVRQTYYKMPEILTDLSPDLRGRVRFLKVSPAIALTVTSEDDAVKQIDKSRPLISERMTLFLRALRPDDFRNSEDIQTIKNELVRRINLAAGRNVARDIVLEELVIQ